MSGVDSVDSVAKVVEPELVAAPLLLGASSRSRDVGIKDETWTRQSGGPFQGREGLGDLGDLMLKMYLYIFVGYW